MDTPPHFPPRTLEPGADEKRTLYLALAMAILLAAFRLLVHFSAPLRKYFLAHTEFPLTQFLVNLVFLGILTLCWIIYRDWRDAVVRHHRLCATEQLRDKLTHMIVHDLKAPISAAMVQLDLCAESADEKLTPRERQYLDQSRDLNRHLSEMVNSLLDVNRLENHEMPINARLTDLVPLADAATQIPAWKTENRRITVRHEPDKVVAFCDPELVRRVILNLLDNAVKFTLPDGEITVRLEQTPDGARVSVADNGAGIPAVYHQKIFDHFAQVEANQYSSGIGLTFCKLAVEAHGGRIAVHSRVGEGATFHFNLPRTPAARTTSRSEGRILNV